MTLSIDHLCPAAASARRRCCCKVTQSQQKHKHTHRHKHKGDVAKLHKVNKNLKEKYSKQLKLKLLRKTPKRETTFLSNLTNNNKLNLKRKVVKYFHPPLSKQKVSSYTFVTSLIQFSLERINLLCQGKVNGGTG